jgi:hypothetical protein
MPGKSESNDKFPTISGAKMTQTLKENTSLKDQIAKVKYRIDLESCEFLELDPSCEKLLDLPGYFIKSSSYLGFIKRIHPVDLKMANTTFDQIGPQKNQILENIRYRFLTGGGGYKWIGDSRKLKLDRSGNAVELVGNLKALS